MAPTRSFPPVLAVRMAQKLTTNDCNGAPNSGNEAHDLTPEALLVRCRL